MPPFWECHQSHGETNTTRRASGQTEAHVEVEWSLAVRCERTRVFLRALESILPCTHDGTTIGEIFWEAVGTNRPRPPCLIGISGIP